MGLPGLVADTPDGYVEAARGAAADLARLSRWRAELRPRMASSPLTDGPRFTRHLEAAYRAMWQHWLAVPGPPRGWARRKVGHETGRASAPTVGADT